MSRTFTLHNNNAEKLLAIGKKKPFINNQVNYPILNFI